MVWLTKFCLCIETWVLGLLLSAMQSLWAVGPTAHMSADPAPPGTSFAIATFPTELLLLLHESDAGY